MPRGRLRRVATRNERGATFDQVQLGAKRVQPRRDIERRVEPGAICNGTVQQIQHGIREPALPVIQPLVAQPHVPGEQRVRQGWRLRVQSQRQVRSHTFGLERYIRLHAEGPRHPCAPVGSHRELPRPHLPQQHPASMHAGPQLTDLKSRSNARSDPVLAQLSQVPDRHPRRGLHASTIERPAQRMFAFSGWPI